MKNAAKKLFLPAAILCLVICLSQTALASGTFTVTAGVNLREAPSTSSKSMATVPMGTSVEVIEHDPAGWSKVQADGRVGYIRSDFLKYTVSGSSAAFVTTTGVNVRQSPSTSSTSLTSVTGGTSVEVLEHDPAGWSKIQIGSTTGYIRSDFLRQADTAAGSYSGTSEESGAAGEQAPSQTLYTTGNVNLRKSASTSAGIIRTLVKGTAVGVLENGSNGWAKVTHNGTEGYIRSDLLTASEQGDVQIRYTHGATGTVNMRAGPSTSSSIVKSLSNGTEVKVLGIDSDWSRVSHNDTAGYIRSDLLSSSPTSDSGGPIAIMKVITGVNVRSGPSTSTNKLTAYPAGTSVTVLAHESNGWSKISYGNGIAYIKSEYLHAGSGVELVTMSEISGTLPMKKNIRVVDVRTGISFNIQIFSKGVHADYDFPTQADADAMFSTRGGVRSWSARPVWVYVGDRVYAASTHGMPHDVSFISGNGITGHLCLHFHNTTNKNYSYQEDLKKAVVEAYEKRPK